MYEAVVLGGGPGGYVSAIRLGQLGIKTLLVEKHRVGGVCLHAGCIPSKALIQVSEVLMQIREGEKFGLKAEHVSIDWEKAMSWKDALVDRLTKGIHQLLKGNHVEYLQGEGVVESPNTVVVFRDGEPQRIETKYIVLATGSEPIELPDFPFDGEKVISSTEALELKRIPESMLIVGGGYIGLELGMVYAGLGTKVTIVELLEQILPGMSKDIVRALMPEIRKRKITLHTNARAERLFEKDGKTWVTVRKGDKVFDVEANVVLVTVGRKPRTRTQALEKLNLELDEKGFIRVDEQRRTSVPNVFAIGDIAGQPMLAHKASHEGEIVAEVIAGKKVACDYRVVPAVVFTHPEIAVVGLTEADAEKEGRDIRIGRFPLTALSRAQILGATRGYVKLIADAESGVLLGGEIVSPEASSLIGELALAIEMGATAEDVALTIHPHPTLTESIMESAKAVFGSAIHILNS